MNAFLEKLFGSKTDATEREFYLALALVILFLGPKLIFWITRKLFHFPPKIKLPKLPFDIPELVFQIIIGIAFLVGFIIYNFIL